MVAAWLLEKNPSQTKLNIPPKKPQNQTKQTKNQQKTQQNPPEQTNKKK